MALLSIPTAGTMTTLIDTNRLGLKRVLAVLILGIVLICEQFLFNEKYSLLQIEIKKSSLRHRRLNTDSSEVNKERVWFLRGVPQAQGGNKQGGAPGGWICPHDGQRLQDPIVVVGTDGSGTRVVAKLLALLNVTVLVETGVYGQMDVDGRVAQVHFTGTIQHVLAAAGSPNYQLSEPPTPQRANAAAVLGGPAAAEARSLTKAFASTMRSNACAAAGDVGARKSGAPVAPSPSFAWAFKKPDLMNLLPFLVEEFPDIQVRPFAL
jgi:hypothetical protein